MSKDFEDLLPLVNAGDVEGCVAWFSGMPEAERRALAPRCLEEAKTIRQNGWAQSGSTYTSTLASTCGAILALCTGSPRELARIPIHELPRHDLAYRLLEDRDPPWLDKWVDHLLGQEQYWGSWTLVRRLVREGRVQRPTTARYALAMIGGIGAPVLEQLRNDPALLEDEIWEIFVHEGGGENSLANVDRWGGGWASALTVLAHEGRIDRQRLLDGCLDALQRDFNHYRARWFTRFFDGLEPSPEELRARADRFLALLRMTAPPVVAWATAKVDKLARKKAYDPQILVVALEPVLTARAKGLVKRTLALLARLAKDASLRPAVARSAVRALGHEAQDVQALALDLLESAGDREDTTLSAELESYQDLVAPTLRPRVDTWLGVTPEVPHLDPPPDASELAPRLRALYAIDDLLAQPSPGAWTLPAARFDGTELPRLVGRAVLTPVVDLDELLDLCARGFEDALGPDDVERALDGVARMARERPDDFERRVGPVAKRAHKVLESSTPFVGDGPPTELAGVVVAWLAGDSPTVRFEERHQHRYAFVELAGQTRRRFAGDTLKTIGFLSRRALSVAQQVGAGIARPLLAAPTHSGGLLDPRVLAERVSDWSGAAPPVTEVVLAMLRLAPEHRADALHRLPAKGPEWIRAIRYALGGHEDIGDRPALWLSAARVRSPWTADPAVHRRFPEAGPDGGEPADYGRILADGRSVGFRFSGADPASQDHVDADCPPQLLHFERSQHMWALGGTETSIRWMATIWPVARESLFAASAVAIGSNLDWWDARWHAKALLEPLLEPDTPLREMGLLLLAVGLGAKEPGEHLLAVDAAIAAIEDGRLGSDNLGRILGEVLPQRFVKLGRYAKTLTAISDVSEAHAAVVFLALDGALPAVLRDPPRDHGRLVELVEQLAARLDAGVHDPARTALGELRGSSKAAKAARRVLERSTATSDRMTAATHELAQMRIAAASTRTPR